MTNQICDAFGLPRMDEILKQEIEIEEPVEADDASTDDDSQNIATGMDIVASADKVLHHVEHMEGTEEHVEEMNEVYDEAMKGYKDLFDLAMNMDAGRASSIAEAAVQMLKTALDASKVKQDSRLKRLKLRMDREKMDREKKIEASNVVDVSSGDGTIMANRNDLLKLFRDKQNR